MGRRDIRHEALPCRVGVLVRLPLCEGAAIPVAMSNFFAPQADRAFGGDSASGRVGGRDHFFGSVEDLGRFAEEVLPPVFGRLCSKLSLHNFADPGLLEGDDVRLPTSYFVSFGNERRTLVAEDPEVHVLLMP